MRPRYCASMLSRKANDSVTWQSADTMKYLLGSPGRAVRVQPSTPGLPRRQAFFTTVDITSYDGPPAPLRQPHRPAVVGRPVLPDSLAGHADGHVLVRRVE